MAVVVHAGDGGGLGGAFPQADSLVDAAWGASPTLRPSALAPSPDPAGDFSAIGPFDVATLHLPVEVWLTALVLGGVLDRHPGLMIGVAEVGAQWIPSWIERLDRAGDPDAFRGLGLSPLPERPSAYVRRQVRVTPLYREPVGEYVATSGLREVYAFGSDYPHQEGGRDPVGRFGATFGRDTAAAKSFFVDNGLALLGN